jgi:hypothetical protein
MAQFLIYLNSLFDLLLLSPSMAGRYSFLIIMSLISAVVFLLIFKVTSNQRKIRRYKQQAFAYILQMRLHRDQLGLLFGSIFNILKYNLLYIRQNLVPLLMVCLPLILFTVQVNHRCGYQPLAPGQTFIIRAQLDALAPTVANSAPDGIACEGAPDILIETPPLQLMSESQVFWRARVATRPETPLPTIQLKIPGQHWDVRRGIAVGNSLSRFGPTLTQWSLIDGIVANAEGFLPETTAVQSVTINYARASYPLLFWRLDALVLYFLFTLILALCLKGAFKVTF